MVRDACRLLGIGQPTKVVGWMQGHRNSLAPPIMKRTYIPIAGAQELSFLDLIETRFVEHFRRQGVTLQSLRKAAQTLRELLGQDHPFATSNVKFMTDRQEVFVRAANEERDTVLLNLVTKQYEMYAVLEEVLARGLAFHPSSGIALEWHPKPKEFPSVLLNPKISFGQPIIMPHKVPTEAIFNSWKAEDGSYQAVAEWFDVAESAAREAVEFELSLPN